MNSFTLVAGLMDESSVLPNGDDRAVGFARVNSFGGGLGAVGGGGGLAVEISGIVFRVQVCKVAKGKFVDSIGIVLASESFFIKLCCVNCLDPGAVADEEGEHDDDGLNLKLDEEVIRCWLW